VGRISFRLWAWAVCANCGADTQFSGRHPAPQFLNQTVGKNSGLIDFLEHLANMLLNSALNFNKDYVLFSAIKTSSSINWNYRCLLLHF
jgi:hypothetical protein